MSLFKRVIVETHDCSLSQRAGHLFVQESEPAAMCDTLLPIAVRTGRRASVDGLADCSTVALYRDSIRGYMAPWVCRIHSQLE